jgi:hypothetical protein
MKIQFPNGKICSLRTSWRKSGKENKEREVAREGKEIYLVF